MSEIHTKSTDGKTHRLTIDGQSVTIRYVTAPQFDNQVQGDLIRRFWDRYGPRTIGVVSGGVGIIDPTLD